jgi:NAD(P)-dependent dehydrogenase (short-subunit alcohol dehydrogenase family)
MYSLCDRVVVLTGGSRGLGLALARAYAREGARIVIAARDAPELQRAHDELVMRGADVLAFPCDVTDEAQLAQLARVTVDWFGRIDVLVNVAGVMEVGPLETMTNDDYKLAMATHFWGPLWASRAMIPEMRRHGRGRIVNVSSIGGLVGAPHMAPYVASKFALTGLSEVLRAELAKERILVTTVYPGLMRTGSARHAIFKGNHQREHAWFSIGAALPLLTMSALRAARRIVRATKRGEPQVILGVPAKLLALLHALAPNLLAHLMSAVNRLLPSVRGAVFPMEGRTGLESTSTLSPSVLTTLGDRAAAENNEFPPSGVRWP